MPANKTYIAIDLKSFYASVECNERGLDPMTTNLVVADRTRTQKTICLAVSPSLKQYGIPGRARLFEAVQKVREANAARRRLAPNRKLVGRSCNATELDRDPSLEIDFIVAPPRMAYYMEYSTRIYQVYLKHVAPEDIHVYSIDEVFIDATAYLKTAKMTGREFARMLIKDVLNTTGITATAGIGTNLYLCKVAMDIVAKHVEADEDGVRIAELDEMSYRRQLWSHQPITDFWRVGRGYAKSLEKVGIYTMGDIAKCSTGDVNNYYSEALLYKLFGVNAELLIDHAWGWEPCTIADIKAYQPQSNSISSGQVLQYPYEFDKAKLIVREMTEALVLDLVRKGVVTKQIVLNIGYDRESLEGDRGKKYTGPVAMDHYGRKVPKHAHGTGNIDHYTSSTHAIMDTVMELYERVVHKDLLIRRVNIAACNLITEDQIPDDKPEQLDMFTDYEALERERQANRAAEEKERKLQRVTLSMQDRFGKNAILKGMNLVEGGTMIERNGQIGGHKAGDE